MKMDDLLLYRFFKGDVSAEEKLAVKDWVTTSKENERVFLQQRHLFDTIVLTQKLEKRVGHKNNIQANEFIRIAATILITLLCSFLGFYLYSNIDKAPEPLLVQTINVPIGQRVNLDLPDGTNVWLNSGATLEYPVDFGRADQRRVSLKGEGFFKVAHDKKKPFIVETYAMNVKALGTEFNVYANEDASAFETTLFEGLVALDSHSNIQIGTLTPNHKMTLMPDGRLVKSIVSDYDSYRWKEGLYCFKSKHLNEIIEELERYYDTHVVLETGKYNKARITGKFRIKDGINSVMQVLQRELGFRFDYDREMNVVTIK
ncbi:MAG: FecR domain-containing protein [Bacteroidales bacterium]|nr:FecR domain-containing protein [Bacteroidales bacterium]